MLVGCQNEDLVQQSAQQNYSLKVSMDTKSRTYIDGETGKCLWGEDEKIFVTSKDGKTTGILSLSSKSEDGTSAIFSGVVMGNPSTLYYSVYPVPDNNGEIDITAINGANHNAPMHGVIDIRKHPKKYPL